MERRQPSNSSASDAGQSAAERRAASAADRDLVARSLAGESPAVSLLVDRLTPVVQARVARRLLAHGRGRERNVRQEVEDLVQEVFLQLFADNGRVLREWRPERGLSLENFVGLVAERQTISILRTGKRNPWKEDPTLSEELDRASPEASPEEAVASREGLRKVLDQLRESLSPLGWQLFDLIYLRELSVVEVEGQTGLSREAIYAWRSRLRRLARRLWIESTSNFEA